MMNYLNLMFTENGVIIILLEFIINRGDRMKDKILALLTYSFITLSLTAIMLGCLHVWSVQ